MFKAKFNSNQTYNIHGKNLPIFLKPFSLLFEKLNTKKKIIFKHLDRQTNKNSHWRKLLLIPDRFIGISKMLQNYKSLPNQEKKKPPPQSARLKELLTEVVEENSKQIYGYLSASDLQNLKKSTYK